MTPLTKRLITAYVKLKNPIDYNNMPSEIYKLRDKKAQVAALRKLGYDGWLHRTAHVINAKNGKIYKLTFDVAKAADGRHILYATKDKIKLVGSAKVGSLKNRGPKQNSNYSGRIAHTDLEVKRKDLEYQYAVNRGDLKSAQRMVDTAAKDAGYTIMAYHGTTNKEEHSTWNAERRSWDTTYTPISVITTHLLYLLYFL